MIIPTIPVLDSILESYQRLDIADDILGSGLKITADTGFAVPWHICAQFKDEKLIVPKSTKRVKEKEENRNRTHKSVEEAESQDELIAPLSWAQRLKRVCKNNGVGGKCRSKTWNSNREIMGIEDSPDPLILKLNQRGSNEVDQAARTVDNKRVTLPVISANTGVCRRKTAPIS
jgi:hypothetical protein